MEGERLQEMKNGTHDVSNGEKVERANGTHDLSNEEKVATETETSNEEKVASQASETETSNEEKVAGETFKTEASNEEKVASEASEETESDNEVEVEIDYGNEETWSKETEEDVEINALSFLLHTYMEYLFPRALPLLTKCPHFDKFIHSVVDAVAELVVKLYTVEDCYRVDSSYKLLQQINDLWSYLVDLHNGEDANPLYAYKLLASNMVDFSKYPLVREENVARMMLTYYVKIFARSPLEKPYFSGYFGLRAKSDSVLEQAIRKAKTAAQKLTADQFTHLLIELTHDSCNNLQSHLVSHTEKKFDMEALGKADSEVLSDSWFGLFCESMSGEPKALLDSLAMEIPELALSRRKALIEDELAITLSPWNNLLIEWGLEASKEVESLIIVAECRRRAVGARFIGRSHFIWAFQERGYVVTRWMKEGSGFDKEYGPCPYHIYSTSILLAKRLGAKTVEPEHLAYAVIYAESVQPGRKKVKEMGKEFYFHFKKGHKLRRKVVEKCLIPSQDINI